MSLPVLQLRPAIYSRNKKVDSLYRILSIAPRQSPNSLEAIDGHVADFQLSDSSDTRYGRYGTLTEFYQAFQPSQIVVHCTDGKIFIEVGTDNDGHPVFKIRGRTQKC